MAYTRYKGDPYWKRAKVGGTSADGTPYAKGDRVFFYPRSGATYAGDAVPRISRVRRAGKPRRLTLSPNRHHRLFGVSTYGPEKGLRIMEGLGLVEVT
jgi:hypothetical protein